MQRTASTGWVGVVWSTKNSLMNTEDPSDHLESMRFARGLLLILVLF